MYGEVHHLALHINYSPGDLVQETHGSGDLLQEARSQRDTCHRRPVRTEKKPVHICGKFEYKESDNGQIPFFSFSFFFRLGLC